MRFAKKSVVLIGVLALGVFLCYAQVEKIAEQPGQIRKDATVILATKIPGEAEGNGSGFFVREDLIVTNIHVVAGIYGKPFRCSVKSADQLRQYTIKGVIASDPEHDLVILKVEGEGAGILQLGDSGTVKLNDEVTAIGTHGDTPSKGVPCPITRITADFFRVKAILLSGYSGGPVLNDAGEVVGVCVGGGETKNSGYVIPSNHLSALLKTIPIAEKCLEAWREEPLIRAYAIVRQGDESVAFGNTKDAIAAYDAAIRLKPNFAAAYVRRGSAKYKLGNYKGAITDYNVAIRLGLDYATVYVNRGVAKRQLRNYSEAIKDYDTAIRLDPENAEAYFNRGNANLDLEHNRLAITDYSMTIRLKPRGIMLAIPYVKRAEAKFNLGDHIGAIEDYNEVIRLNLNDPDIHTIAYLNRGLVKFDLGEISSAIEDYGTVIRRNPKDTIPISVRLHRARAKSKLGDHVGAIRDYDAALRLSPETTDRTAYIYNKRAAAKLTINANKGAIADSSLAIRLDPDLAEAYRIRGDAKSNLGNHREAIKDYDIAIYLKPDYTKAYYKRGSAKIEIGNISEAKIDFQTALKLVESNGTPLLKEKIDLGLRLLE